MCFYVSDLPLEMYQTDTKYTFKNFYVSETCVSSGDNCTVSQRRERIYSKREDMREKELSPFSLRKRENWCLVDIRLKIYALNATMFTV